MWFQLLLLSLGVYAEQDDLCRILVLAGGGSLGAYQAGLLRGFLENDNPGNYTYEYISGASAGALNTLGLSMFAKGDEAAGADLLEQVWGNLTSDDQIFTWNKFPKSLFDDTSIANSDPLRRLINQIMDEHGPTKRKFIVGASDLNTGDHVAFDETLSSADQVEAAMCSSAIPTVFPYQNFMNSTYVDGGFTLNMDVFTPINRCLADGYAEEDIVIDMWNLM